MKIIYDQYGKTRNKHKQKLKQKLVLNYHPCSLYSLLTTVNADYNL